MSVSNSNQWLRAVFFFGSMVLAAQYANAVPMLRLDDGINAALTVSDNGAGDTNPLVGAIVLNQSYNNWNINVDTGLTKPALGDPNNPHMDLGFINVSNLLASGSPENLTIEFSDVDFLNSSGLQGLLMNWGGNYAGYRFRQHLG